MRLHERVPLESIGHAHASTFASHMEQAASRSMQGKHQKLSPLSGIINQLCERGGPRRGFNFRNCCLMTSRVAVGGRVLGISPCDRAQVSKSGAGTPKVTINFNITIRYSPILLKLAECTHQQVRTQRVCAAKSLGSRDRLAFESVRQLVPRALWMYGTSCRPDASLIQNG